MNETSAGDEAPYGCEWIERALGDQFADSFTAVERLALAFQHRLKDDDLVDDERLLVEALAGVTSAMLKEGNWLEPFAPAMQFDGRRSAIPSDLSTEQLALLERALPGIARDDLRARVADVCWLYGNRGNVDLFDAAVDAYLQAPLEADTWHSGGEGAWQRGLDLLHRRGADGRGRIDAAVERVEARVLAGTVEDRYFLAQLSEFLRENARPDQDSSRSVANLLTVMAANALPDGRLSRHLEREAGVWFSRANDDASALACAERAAQTYELEADQRVEAEAEGAALAESIFVEKAIASYVLLPRSYREANGIEGRLPQLRERLRLSRERAREAMIPISGEPMDLTAFVADARNAVSGHEDVLRALAAFVSLSPPIDPVQARASAETLVSGSFSHIFGTETLSRDGRKVASRPGVSADNSESAVWAEVMRYITVSVQIAAKARILPALDILAFEHRISERVLMDLCADSPTVPEGHANLWTAGLSLGFSRDFGPAIAILVPQVEQLIRVQLKRRGVHTQVVDEDGVETEKSITALLDLPETTEIFGEGMVVEMKALLIDQAGSNQRHDIAHGLFDDAAGWTYEAVFMWWFCLRLAVWPALQMRLDGQPTADAVGPAEAEDEPLEDPAT